MPKPRKPRRPRAPIQLKPATGNNGPILYYQLPEQAQSLLNDLCNEMRLLALLTLPRTPEERRLPGLELSIPAEPLASCFARSFLTLQQVLKQAKPLTPGWDEPASA
jgi:hypothetical protein